MTVVTPHCCVDCVTIVKSALFYAAAWPNIPRVRTQSDSDKSLVGISSRTEFNCWQYKLGIACLGSAGTRWPGHAGGAPHAVGTSKQEQAVRVETQLYSWNK